MMKYKFDDSNPTIQPVPVIITEGKYKGVRFQYGRISFDEQGDSMALKFDYNLIENPNKLEENQEFVDTLEKFYKLTKEARDQLGKAGREHVVKNYSFEKYQNGWVKVIDQLCEENGSWENRKNYRSWRLDQL